MLKWTTCVYKEKESECSNITFWDILKGLVTNAEY